MHVFIQLIELIFFLLNLFNCVEIISFLRKFLIDHWLRIHLLRRTLNRRNHLLRQSGNHSYLLGHHRHLLPRHHWREHSSLETLNHLHGFSEVLSLLFFHYFNNVRRILYVRHFGSNKWFKKVSLIFHQFDEIRKMSWVAENNSESFFSIFDSKNGFCFYVITFLNNVRINNRFDLFESDVAFNGRNFVVKLSFMLFKFRIGIFFISILISLSNNIIIFSIFVIKEKTIGFSSGGKSKRNDVFFFILT